MEPEKISRNRPIILFDGVCNLCNSFINFVMDHDGGRFQFASIQSDPGSELMCGVGLSPEDLETFVVINGNDTYTKSRASLFVLRNLGFPYSMLYLSIVVPRFLRDPVYEFISSHRYDWFGRRDKCRMPNEEKEERFISQKHN